MNDSTQQETQATETEIDQTAALEATETVEQEETETETNADDTADSLDAHLKQFDAMHNASQEPQQAGADTVSGQSEQPTDAPGEGNGIDNSAPDTRMDLLWERHEQDMRRRANEDVQSAIKVMQEESPILKAMPAYLAKGALEELNRQDPRVGRAFALRHDDPALWDQTVRQLGKKLERDLSRQPDAEASKGADAVRASVNSQSGGEVSTGPSDDEIAQMSDAEWRRFAASLK